MRQLRIGYRLALSFALIVMVTLLGSVFALWQFNGVRAQIERSNQVNDEVIAILRVNNDVLNIRRELQRLIQIQDATRFDQEATRLRDQLQQDIKAAIDILENSPLTNQEPRNIAQLRQLSDLANLSSQIELMKELAEAGDWLAVRLRLENQVEQVSQITQTLVEDIDQVVAAERTRVLAKVSGVQQQAYLAILATSLLTLVVAITLGVYVTSSIAQPLISLNRGARALAQREFNVQLAITGDDELSNFGRAFNDAASQLAKLYADMETLVQERTNELHRRALQLETSLAVGHSITSILDLDKLLPQVVELIKERYGHNYVGVFLLDEGGQYIEAQAGTGEAGRILRQQHFRMRVGPDEKGLVNWVVTHRRPVRVDDVSEDDRYIPLEVVPNTRSEMVLPLAMGTKMLGTLDIQSDQLTAFRLDDVPVFQLLADQVAIAIQNATLYQAEQSRRRLTEALYHAGRAVSSTLDLAQVLNLILENLVEIVPYDRAALLLQDRQALKIVADRGFPSEMSPTELRIIVKEGDVFDQIQKSRQPLVLPDVLKRADWQHVEGLPPARAWLGVPLIRFENVTGMLSLTRETPNAYHEDEVTLAETFAGQVAIALENARLYDEITRFSHQLEELVQERTKELKEAYTQLKHLDQTKSDFIHISAHELRTPLTVLQGYSQMLLQEGQIKENAYHLELITSIHLGAQRLHEIVNSMLDITKIDSRALKLYPEPVEIPSLIQLVCQKFAQPLEERRLTLTVEEMPDLPSIEADPDALSKVFYHLVVNAIKYTPDGGSITISGRSTQQQNRRTVDGIQITIEDAGIGIDPEFHDLIFTKFYQTGELAFHSTGKTKFKGAGPGLGLAIAKGIMEAHQGQVWVESEGYDEETYPGSCFHIFLPLRQQDEGQPEPDKDQWVAQPERLVNEQI